MPFKPKTRSEKWIERNPNYLKMERRVADKKRNSDSRRKLYNTTAWRRYRKAFITTHPTCVRCSEVGRVVESQVVHHLCDDEELFFKDNNYISICKRCHDSLSYREEERLRKKYFREEEGEEEGE